MEGQAHEEENCLILDEVAVTVVPHSSSSFYKKYTVVNVHHRASLQYTAVPFEQKSQPHVGV
jgi:hypothetical protein